MDKGNQLIFLHEEIFRNLMTYHDVKDGTITPKRELVPTMWEHRIEGGGRVTKCNSRRGK